jgi:hypothetical protein
MAVCVYLDWKLSSFIQHNDDDSLLVSKQNKSSLCPFSGGRFGSLLNSDTEFCDRDRSQVLVATLHRTPHRHQLREPVWNPLRLTASFVGPPGQFSSPTMGSDVTSHGKGPSCHLGHLLENRVVFKTNRPGARRAQFGVSLGVAAGRVVTGYMGSCTYWWELFDTQVPCTACQMG